MKKKTQQERLIFIDNLVRGFLSFGLMGSFCGIIIYTLSESLWITIKFNLLLWILTSPLMYVRSYNSVLESVMKKVGNRREEACSQAIGKAKKIANTSALEWAVLLPLSSITGAVLFSMTFPNVYLALPLVIANALLWGYAHAKVFTPVYIQVANPENVFNISKFLYRKLGWNKNGMW